MPVFESHITQENIERLAVAFEYKTHSYVTAQPLIWKERLYCSDWAGYIYCLDAQSGKLIYEKGCTSPLSQTCC